MKRKPEDRTASRPDLSRRQFLKGVGLAGAGGALGSGLLSDAESAEGRPLSHAPAVVRTGARQIALQVNDKRVTVAVEPRTTLLTALRDHADPPITGAKLVCDQGACGACTVLLDDRPVYACMALAMDAIGKSITTVEGLSGEGLSPLQEAFVEADALMCGFCTPGFLVSLAALKRSHPNPTVEQVKGACAGNVCRCGTYPRIFEAATGSRARKEG